MDAFDCLVIGGGWGGMAFALLNGMSGRKTALIECHDRLGGYGHCFEESSYRFCANMHYFFETQTNGMVDRFLKRVRLDQEITFDSLDKDGFDLVRVKDFSFKIPSGLANYQDKLLNQFPESSEAIKKVFTIRDNVDLFIQLFFDENKPLWSIMMDYPSEFINLARFSLRSSCAVLDSLGIHDHLRTILLSRLGNLGLTSRDVPILILLMEMTLYTNNAAFPAHGMHHFIEKMHEKLLENNVTVLLNTEIRKINHHENSVTSVIDQNGREFTAKLFISDIDPQLTFKLCDYPVSYKYQYQYTYSCFSLYLGLKDINLEEHSLGNFNVWYYPGNALDDDCDAVLNKLDYTRSFLFVSTPSAHVKPGVLSPRGSHTMQIVAPANYAAIARLQEDSPAEFDAYKEKIKNYMLDTISHHFIPDIRKHIEVMQLWSPMDLASKVKTPCGAIYGMRPDLRKAIWPVGHNSPFNNLYFVGATASYPGLGPVISGAMKLFDKLQSENGVTG